MQINVSYSKGGGKPTEMRIDARPLQDYLRALGVPLEHEGTADERFTEGPHSDYRLVNVNTCSVSPAALLRTANGGQVCIKLSEHFRNPPSRDQMEMLANSVATVGQQIIEHYQPIEVSLVINFRGKEARPAANNILF